MRITPIKTLLSLAALAALSAHAAQQTPPAAAASAPAPGAHAAARFDALDSNKDGVLSREEFLAGRAQMHGRGGMRGKAGGPHGGLASLPLAADGTLARSTVEKLNRPQMLARFDAMDSNKDGSLSAAERAACPQQPR